MSTPTRSALVPKSALHQFICDGLSAVKDSHKKLLHDAVRTSFTDSLDLDAALRAAHGQANRWDYLLGHRTSNAVVGLEPHTASTGEVGTVIAKRKAAIEQLKKHLKPSSYVAEWFWVASGRVDFVPFDRHVLRLEQAGIRFVGKMLREEHLPKGRARPPRKRRRG